MAKVCIVSFIGIVNSGKSTLINNLLEKKISNMMHKKHSTREIIYFLLKKKNMYLIFLDTPGFINMPYLKLETFLTQTSLKSLYNSHISCIIFDITKCINFYLQFLPFKYCLKLVKKPIFIINKIDMINNKKYIASIIKLVKYQGVKKIFLISFFNIKGIYSLRRYLFSITFNKKIKIYNHVNISIKSIINSITIEEIYSYLKSEIPYSLYLNTDIWIEKKNSIYIYQSIFIEEKKKKKIIIGKFGKTIKKIGISSKKKMNFILKKCTHLYIFIRII